MYYSYPTAQALGARKLVCFNAEGKLIQATSSNDKIIGASADIDIKEGSMADVVHLGATKIQFGATISAGDFITSDENGCAKVAAQGENIVGFALEAGVSGDIKTVVIAPCGGVGA